MIDANWQAQFQTNAADFRAVSKSLEIAVESDEILTLTEAKAEVTIRSLWLASLV